MAITMTKAERERLNPFDILNRRVQVLKSTSGDRPGVYCPVCGKVANRWTQKAVTLHATICDMGM